MEESGEMWTEAIKRVVRRKGLSIIVGLIVLSAGITLSFTLMGRKASGSQYFTERVERGPISTLVNATGTVQAVVTVQVGSQVSGQIQALYADYNSVVKRGQILAKIDPRNFQAQLEDSKANVAAAEAHLRSTQADLATQEANLVSAKANLEAARVSRDNDALILKRYTEMVPSGIVAQNDYDTVKANADSSRAKFDQASASVEQVEAQINAQRAQVQQAKAQVMQAQADLNKAQINLEYTNIYSPVDGVVVSRNVDVGQTVAASLQAPLLFVIANDLTKMQVNASVDEADIGHISDFSKVRFTVDAYPNENFSGRIAEIRLNPQTIQNVVTYSVIINVDNADLKLKPGMTANITITVAKRDNALKIPNAALRYLPPGMTREKEMNVASSDPAGDSGQPEAAEARRPAAPGIASFSDNGIVQTRHQPQDLRQASAATGNSQPRHAGETIMPALAPGQMWENSEKIRFPSPSSNVERPAVVWVLNGKGQPEPRRILLGITDGASTEMKSGSLKPGEQVIVADTTQESSSADSRGPRTPFGFGPGRRR
jgi:HlyD family secretion protein